MRRISLRLIVLSALGAGVLALGLTWLTLSLPSAPAEQAGGAKPLASSGPSTNEVSTTAVPATAQVAVEDSPNPATSTPVAQQTEKARPLSPSAGIVDQQPLAPDSAASASAVQGTAEFQWPAPKSDVSIDLADFRQLIPQDTILPVYAPRFVPGVSAKLNPGELVIGVEINGESKAYPIGPLNFREMVNDVVGGVPILVTW